jgi:pimeloyl-ACP methyl ester carboxylesterase
MTGSTRSRRELRPRRARGRAGPARRIRTGVRRGAIIAGAAAGGALMSLAGALTYSAVAIDHAVPLPPAIAAERRTIAQSPAGPLSYYAETQVAGRPLVLVHSINAAASSYEMRPLFEHYRGQRPVYALDLPGFGFSDRSERVYTPDLYVQALLALLDEIGPYAGGVDLVAFSLSSEFAARVALERPEAVHSLVLISPTGFGRRDGATGARDGGAGGSDVAYRLFSFPLWRQAFYDLIASRPSLRYFLKRSFVGEPDPALVDYAYPTSHQPGARNAPLYFVSGKLFTPDIRAAVYERLPQPVLVVYDQDAFVRFDTLPELVQRHTNWRAVRIVPTRGLPQFERPHETYEAISTFWRDAARGWLARATGPAEGG